MLISLELPNYSQDKMNSILEKQDEFYFRLKYLEDHIQTAKKMGLTVCNKCALCCWRNPCDLTKDDMINISKYLGYNSVKDLFKDKLTIHSKEELIEILKSFEINA